MNMPGNTSEELTRRMHAVGAHCNKSGSNNNNNVVPVVHQHYQLPRIHYAYQPAYQHHYVFPNHYQPVYPANWNGWTTAPTYKASKPKKRSSKGKKGKKGSKSRSRKTR
jgi:hypothetical protein